MSKIGSPEWNAALLWVQENMTEVRRKALDAYNDAGLINDTLAYFINATIPSIHFLDLDTDVANGWMYPKIEFGDGEEWYGTIRVADLPQIYADFIAIVSDDGVPDNPARALSILKKHDQTDRELRDDDVHHATGMVDDDNPNAMVALGQFKSRHECKPNQP